MEKVEGLFGVMDSESAPEGRAGNKETGKPRYKPVERNQLLMRTVDIEELVEADHAVRGIWEMTGLLDLSEFEQEIRAREGVAGQRTLSPRLLTSLWIYALSEGVTSARELARMCETDPGCQWLTAMETINYHTLSDFRVDHGPALEKMFVQVVGLLSAEGLIEMKRVAQDGTKIRANAGADTFRREERIQAHLELAQKQIENLSRETDEDISDRGAKARARAQREKKERLELALEELKKIRQTKKGPVDRAEVRVSMTDPEARVMKQADGGYAPNYNVQLTTDSKAGLIVGVEVTQAGNDYASLVGAVDEVEETFGQKPNQVLADGGYASRDNIEAIAAKGIDFIAPVPKTLTSANKSHRHDVAEPFQPRSFPYDSVRDCYICPAGKTLALKETRKRPGLTEFSYRAQAPDCLSCPFKQQCSPNSHNGRWIVRTVNSNVVQAFIAKMETPEAKAIYKTRSQLAEFPNCWIKTKLGLRQFRLRGVVKVRIESVWAAVTFNIQQWLRLKWKLAVATSQA